MLVVVISPNVVNLVIHHSQFSKKLVVQPVPNWEVYGIEPMHC